MLFFRKKYEIKITNNYRIDKLIKGVWGMPRLSEATKDVTSCDKLRGLAHMS